MQGTQFYRGGNLNGWLMEGSSNTGGKYVEMKGASLSAVDIFCFVFAAF